MVKKSKQIKILVGSNLSTIFEKVKHKILPQHREIFLTKLLYMKEDTPLNSDMMSKVDCILDFIEAKKVGYIFVAEKSYYNQIHLAKRVCDKNKRAIFISLDVLQADQKSSYFLNEYKLSLLEFLYLISKTEVIIFSQGWLFRYHQVLLIEMMKSNNKHFIDFMDLNNFLFDQVSGKKAKDLKRVWGEDALENNRLQKWCEKQLFQLSDRCFFPGSISHVKVLGLKKYFKKGSFNVNYSINSDMFVGSPRTTYSGADFVFAGGIPPFDKRRISSFFSDAQLITTFLPMLENNPSLKIDVYNNPMLVGSANYTKLYKPHYQLAKKYDGYNFYPGYSGKKIRQILANYGFGLMIYNHNGILFGEKHFDNLIPTKFYLYLEAGLPVIVSKEWRELCKIITRYNVGIVVDWSPKTDLIELISKLDYYSLTKNVMELRKLLDKSVQGIL